MVVFKTKMKQKIAQNWAQNETFSLLVEIDLGKITELFLPLRTEPNLDFIMVIKDPGPV